MFNLVVPNVAGNNGSLAFQVSPNIDVARIRAPYTSSGHIELAFDIYNNGISEAMRIKDGNVGIGTANPRAPLDIKKSSGDAVLIKTDDTNYGAIFMQASNTAPIIGTTSGGTVGRPPLTFYTNDAERVRIDTTGNVGIGWDFKHMAIGIRTNTEMEGDLRK